MPAKFLLFVSAIMMIALGGVLIGVLGLKATPVNLWVNGNVPILFALGALTGFVAWASIVFATLSLCSELMFVTMGKERIDRISYLLSALLIGNAGDLKIVERGEVVTYKQRGPFARFSTPGYVIIYHGNAVIFEQYGKPSRVGLKGLVKTKPFETIRAAVDLSLQQRQKQVALFTKDGFPLLTEIRILFQIHGGGRSSTVGDMYPVLEQAVLNAVYVVPFWKEYTIETAIGMFRLIIAERYLHEIYDPQKQLTIADDKPKIELRTLRDELLASLDRESFKWGVKIQNLFIEVKPPKGIEDQALAFERARMEQQIAIEGARAENARIRQFMDETGGSVEDYALLQFSENIGGTGSVPVAFDQLLSDAFARANLRTAHRQQAQPKQAVPKAE